MPWGCTVSNWRRDISELFQRESEAAAKTAEAMVVQVPSGASCIRSRAPCRNNFIATAVKCYAGRKGETIVAERKKVVTTAGTTPCRCCRSSASSAPAFQGREARNHARWDSGFDETRYKLGRDRCAPVPATHMEAGNSLATASRLVVGNTLLVTGVDLRKERRMPASTAAAAAAAAACCCGSCGSSLGMGDCCSDACTDAHVYS